jgi:pantoate--beta-alanine ligase
MARLIRPIREMQRAADTLRREGKRIALVPTMGALHAGHLSLVRLAVFHADVVVVSIFVNPAQFGPQEDYDRYPRNLPQDFAEATGVGAEIIFAPEPQEMYPENFTTSVDVKGLGGILEGKARPGHFRGVTTVVAKLFGIVRPHAAIFGQKDAQQVAVIRRMVSDLNFGIDIVVGQTVRESDGLAMSSRNSYLAAEERRQAPALYQALGLAGEAIRQGERDADAIRRVVETHIAAAEAARIDYCSVADAETLQELTDLTPGKPVLVSAAVWFGSTRLIDNVVIGGGKDS